MRRIREDQELPGLPGRLVKFPELLVCGPRHHLKSIFANPGLGRGILVSLEGVKSDGESAPLSVNSRLR